MILRICFQCRLFIGYFGRGSGAIRRQLTSLTISYLTPIILRQGRTCQHILSMCQHHDVSLDSRLDSHSK